MADYLVTNKTNFKVEIDGIDYGNFISVVGLGAKAEVNPSVGGMDFNPENVLGKIKYDAVTCTRNWDGVDSALIEWWQTVESGAPEKRPVSIVYYAADGVTEIKRRNLYDCLPCGWDTSNLDSADSGVLTETISFVYVRGDWA